MLQCDQCSLNLSHTDAIIAKGHILCFSNGLTGPVPGQKIRRIPPVFLLNLNFRSVEMIFFPEDRFRDHYFILFRNRRQTAYCFRCITSECLSFIKTLRPRAVYKTVHFCRLINICIKSAHAGAVISHALPHPVFFGATLKNHIFCQAFHLHMMFHVSILFRIIFTQPLLTQHRLL